MAVEPAEAIYVTFFNLRPAEHRFVGDLSGSLFEHLGWTIIHTFLAMSFGGVNELVGQ